MRLTCKTFASLRTPAAALFYDFNIFATRRSLDQLELLSKNKVLRNYVHRLVFCRPMLEAWPLQNNQYVTALRHERWSQFQSLYPLQQETAGLRAYKLALRKQERLFRKGTYAKTCGRCVARFPLLSSIFISDGIPEALNLDSKSHTKELSLFQRQHRSVLLRSGSYVDVFESADRHVHHVLRALAIAKVQVEELVTYNEWGPSYDFAECGIPAWSRQLDLSKLDRLDLCLRDGKEKPGGADWSAAIYPLMKQLPALTELYLRFYARQNEHPTLVGLWEARAPNLGVLSVEGLTLTREGFCTFLHSHCHLQQLTLYEVRLSDNQWYDLFRLLREHPALEDLEIASVGEGRLKCPIRTIGQPDLSDDLTLELRSYLHREGEWTERLSRYWE